MLYKSLKMLHLVGMTLFLGSIFGHVATSVLAGPPGGSAAFVAARENIQALTMALTLPGLGLTMFSGLAMAFVARMNPSRARWVVLHGLTALTIVVLTVVVVAPTGRRVLDDALSAGLGEALPAKLQADLFVEHIFGAANILLALIAMAVAVWRLRLGRKSPAA